MKLLSNSVLVLFILIFPNVSVIAQTKIACIGNSITYGYGLSSQSTQSYPARLQVLLGCDYVVTNFGISSRTLLKNGDLPYWNESQYTQSLALEPDIVIIMLGTNDSKLDLNWIPYRNEFIDDYKAMINSYLELSSSPRIWACKIVPAYRDIWDIKDSIIYYEVNPKIQKVTFEEGVNLIDMYSPMLNKKSYFIADGIHPNADGAQAMADHIYSVLIHDTLVIQQDENSLIAPEGARYQWYKNNEPIDASEGSQRQIFEATESGDYKVGITINSTSSTVVLSAPYHLEISIVSITDPEVNDPLIEIFPNPCSSSISFHPNGINIISLKCYAMNGELVISKSNIVKDEVLNISTESLSKGLYYYQIQCDNKTILNGKFIVGA